MCSDPFLETYQILSLEGWCDGAGGCEYRRVRAEWEAAGRPRQIAAFIRWRANTRPEANGWA